MTLTRRRSSFLGNTERPATASSAGRTGAAREVCGGGPASGGAARVSRRALGISSVFLQGLRSSVVPVLPRAEAVGGPGAAGAGAAGLSSSLMEYRDKVRALEQLNQQLEQQIRLSLDRRASSAGAWAPIRAQWEEVYRQVSEAILLNARLMLQTENLQANAEDFKERYENERVFREAVEEEIDSLNKVISEANLSRAELEEQMENMKAELRSLELNHEQDVRSLYNQMAGREVDEPDCPIQTSLDQILSYIRGHWEKVMERNRAETDSVLECKEAQCVNSRLSPEEEQLESLKNQCSETGCKIQSLQAETESMRALKRGMESSLSDARHWHHVELQNLSSLVAKLEAELMDVQAEIEQQRRDYNTLLCNKQRLEEQIGAYHCILDGEDGLGQQPEFSGSPAAATDSKDPEPSAQ